MSLFFTATAGVMVMVRLIVLASATSLMVAMQSVIAEVTPPGMTPDGSVTWWAPLINTGAIGVVLGWFMLRMEPRMRAIEAAIDTISLALMIAVLAMKNLDRSISEQAQAIKDRLDAKAAKDKPV